MGTYKCSKCQQIINNDDRESHEMNCLYTFSLDEYQNLIPCELCDELINIEDYQNHVSQCMRTPQYIPLNIPLNAPMAGESEDNLVNMFRNIIDQINQHQQINQDGNVESGENHESNVESGENQESNNESQDANIESQDAIIESHESNENHETNESQDTNIENQDANIENQDANIENHDNIQYPILNLNIDNPNEILNMLAGAYNTETINPLFNVFNFPVPEENESYEDLINLGNSIGDVEIGVSDINKVSKLDFKEINCSICSEDVKIIRRTKCNHEFCSKCLDRWLESKKTCPICMSELE